MASAPLQFVGLGPEHLSLLAEFFESGLGADDRLLFHPHPMTRDMAERLCSYQGQDAYLVAISDQRVFAYGMLRGWDQGYNIPSLGIAVVPSHRGKGLARAFMMYLHLIARLRGADQVRLTVYRRNTSARLLYESLGYTFQAKNDEEDVGILDLRKRAQ